MALKMTLQRLETEIQNIFKDELIPLLRAKGHDYAGEENILGCFEDFGWQGIVVRIGDKYHRLKNFCRQKELSVKDETVEDTLKDLINYGLLALLIKREETKLAGEVVVVTKLELRELIKQSRELEEQKKAANEKD